VSDDWTVIDTFDFDGDGLPDLVEFLGGGPPLIMWGMRNRGGARCDTTAGGQVCNNSINNLVDVIPNVDGATGTRGQRPDLLVATHNGIGAATYLEYRPSTQWSNLLMPFTTWTVTRIEHDDGMCFGAFCATGGAHSVATNILYYSGKFDPLNRQFRGFAQVDAQQDRGGGIPPGPADLVQPRCRAGGQGAGDLRI
jgi:hypothetical protein